MGYVIATHVQISRAIGGIFGVEVGPHKHLSLMNPPQGMDLMDPTDPVTDLTGPGVSCLGYMTV
jgi:hypothetical protein